MNMTKTIYLSGMFLAFLCTLLLMSCNNEESNPLRFDLSADADNAVNVYFPQNSEDGNTGAITILGGDGHYTAQCDNPAVLKIDMKFSNAFVLYPQDWGEAHVTVTDGTGTNIVLKVTILQNKLTLTIGHMDIRIEGGEALTETQKSKLCEEATATLPVKAAGGGYRLVYDDPQDPTRGTLYVYPTEMGKEEEKVEGSFLLNLDYGEESSWLYRFRLEEKEHTLSVVPYTGTKNVSQTISSASIALQEDVTEQIPTVYPGVKVITRQVIWRPIN